jgi:hypothetical protein
MGNGCTTILTKDSLEQNLNIKKETYNYKLYKKSRTNKCTNNTHKTHKKSNNKKIKSNNKSSSSNKPIYESINNLENNNLENNNLENNNLENNNKLTSEKRNKNIQEFNINEYLYNKKKIKQLNNYINKLETELMNHTINTIKEKIENLNNEKVINNTINNLKCKNAKLFQSYLELKKSRSVHVN